jgi:predicted SAM-dependent methyltransferase
MIPRSVKNAYYTLLNPFMRLNGLRYRYLTKKSDQQRVHLGPGQNNYLIGWVNIDANAFTTHCDVWCNLRYTLPFENNSVSAFYSHHVVEHLPSLVQHFADVYRCLKPGGSYRVGGPNGDAAIHKFVENDLEWFDSFPDDRASIGGRFENFVFCRQEHLTILTESYLTEIMSKTGFEKIQAMKPSLSTSKDELFSDCLAIEAESDFDWPHTLILEGHKPG